MAHSLRVRDHRHAGVLLHESNQCLATAGDGQVDGIGLMQELENGVSIARRKHLNGIGRKSGTLQRFPNQDKDRFVGPRRVGSAPEHDRVARLETKCAGIDRDVGARLVHDGDDPNRYRDPPYAQAVGAIDVREDVAHRILERSYLLDGFGHLFDASHIEGQPVQESIARAARPGHVNVASVGGNQIDCACTKTGGQLCQDGVLGLAIAGSDLARCDSGAPANRNNLGCHAAIGSTKVG